MLNNFFGKSKPINYLIIFSLFSLHLFFFFIKGNHTVYFTDNKWFMYVFLIFLVICNFLFYNFVLSKNQLTLYNSYGFFAYAMFLVLIPKSLLNLKALLISLIILLFLRKTYSLQSSKNIHRKIFDAAFWLGIAFILEPETILFFLFLQIAIFIHKKNKINYYITPFLGISAPIIIYFSYCFWFDKTEVFTNLFKSDFLFKEINISELEAVIFTILLFATTVSVFFKSTKVMPINNVFRKNWVLIVINFFIAFLFFLITEERKGFFLFLFPTSIIIANGIELIKKKWAVNFILFLIAFLPALLLIVF